jgi:hypothetical protein
MSQFDEDYEAIAAPMLVEQFGDVVSYTPAGSQIFDLSIIVGPEQIEETMEVDGVKRRHVRECSIPVTALAAGGGLFVAEPTIHDVFAFNGVSYMINRILARTASMTRVAAVLLATHEEARQALRRRN